VDLYIAQIIIQEAKKFETGTNEQQTHLLISDGELT
jgi:hypothetical protein